jgi:hypothetical protein
MKGESTKSREVRLTVAGRRAVAGAVGASLSLPLAASAFAAPVCACGGGGSTDPGTDSIPAPEEPAASSPEPDAPSPPAHNPSPPREERPVIPDPEPSPPPSEPSPSPQPSPQLERLIREEERYNSSPPVGVEEPESSEPVDPPPEPTPTPPAASEPVEEPAEEPAAPATPQTYGVDSYLYAHLPPDDQAAIRESYERRAQPEAQEPDPQPQPEESQPQPEESQVPPEPEPAPPPPPPPAPPASAPTPSADAADPPPPTTPPPAASEPAEEPVAPARPQSYGVDSYLYAHLPPEDQAAIRESYERRMEPEAPPPQPEPESPPPAPTPPAASEPAEEPVAPARPQTYGVDSYLYAHLPPEDQAAIREGYERRTGSESRPQPADAEPGPPAPTRPAVSEPAEEPALATGCTPVQGPYLDEADRPCVFPDGRSVPVAQIGTQPAPPEPSEPQPTGVGSGGGGGGSGSWGREEEQEEQDKPWWEDGFSALGGALSWTGEQTVGVGRGFVEGVQGIGEGGLMLYRLSPTNAILDNESWREEWSNVGDAAQYAWENPSEFGQAVINWEDIEEGRYGEWLGNLGPDAIVAVATAGSGAAATATTRAVRSADEVADLADVAQDADRAADAARDAERAADARRAAALDAAATQRWLDELPTKPTPSRTPADRFEIEHTGPVNYRLTGGGESVWTDGFRVSDWTALEAKHVGNPERSPYVDGSTLPEPVRAAIQADLENELQRYGAVIRSDPHVRQLEIITNEPRAVPKFEELMQRLGVPGQVRLVDD